MSQKEEVQNWYNQFAASQKKTGVNLRHYTIINKAIELGLTKNSSVLEIGCGIGTLTGLINKFVSKGKLVATDISDASIELAKEWIAKSDRIEFVVTDMTDFIYPTAFDFIILPDVLEHIPKEQHENLFKTIRSLMHADSVILIHIPHPIALNFLRIHHPENLQVIDQSLHADFLIDVFYKNDLQLIQYLSYSLFAVEHDYVFMFLKPMQETRITPLSQFQIIRKKLTQRLKLAFS